MSPLKNIMIAVTAVALTAALAGCGSDDKVELSAAQEKEVAERLAPAGEVALEGETQQASAAPAVAAGPRSGEEIFTGKCFACHGTGAAGAPKIGSAADWGPRVAQGIDALYTNAISGVRGMPPKGLCMDCSDDELKAAVDHMVAGSK